MSQLWCTCCYAVYVLSRPGHEFGSSMNSLSQYMPNLTLVDTHGCVLIDKSWVSGQPILVAHWISQGAAAPLTGVLSELLPTNHYLLRNKPALFFRTFLFRQIIIRTFFSLALYVGAHDSKLTQDRSSLWSSVFTGCWLPVNPLLIKPSPSQAQSRLVG